MSSISRSKYEVTELTWENGQLALHGLGGILPPPPPPQTMQTGDTLESIVQQATQLPQTGRNHQEVKYSPSLPVNSGGKWGENSTSHIRMEHINQDGKWRENSSHMHLQHENPEGGLSSSGGKWREKSAHMEAKANPPVVLQPTSSSGKRRENLEMDEQKGVRRLSSVGASSGGKWGENHYSVGNKRLRSESEQRCGRKSTFQVEESACASASAAFCRDTDTTMMTWASFESPRSLKSARNADEDSACHDCSENQDGSQRMKKEESFRSQSSARRSRAAAVHNQSERRRRDRINEKMKTLQKLVPNASKTDKASMLDEVIEYLKQLQAQVQMMSNARNMPQMMMPLGMQQQLQMALLARMGIMGMGMPHSIPPLIHAGAAPLGGTTATSFVSPPFTMPPVVPPPPMTTPLKANVNAAHINASVPNFNFDAYNTFLTQQSMNMDFFNKMAALYRQQTTQPSKKPVTFSHPNDAGGE